MRSFSVLVGCLVVGLFAEGLTGCSDSPDPEAAEAAGAAATDWGVLDPRFGTKGMVRGSKLADGTVSAMAFDDEARMLLVTSRWGDDVLRVERRRADGTVDPTFALASPLPVVMPPDSGAIAIQPAPDGGLFVAVSALCALSKCPVDFDRPGRVDRYLLRLSPNGRLDATFAGGKGYLTIDSPQQGLGTYPMHLARTPSGQLVFATDQPGGGVDVFWIDNAGRILAKQGVRGLPGWTNAVAATNDNAYLGRAGDNTHGLGMVVGLTRATGAVNQGMGAWRTEGLQRCPLLSQVVTTPTNVWAIGCDVEEGNYGPNRFSVRKLGFDLLPDRSFGSNGTKVFNAGEGKGGSVSDMRVLADGRIVLVGAIEAKGNFKTNKDGNPGLVPGDEDELGFVVLRPDGAFDTSFASRGTGLVHAGSNKERLVTMTSSAAGIFAAGFSGATPILTKLFL